MANFSRSCTIFFVKKGVVYEARQTVQTLLDYSRYYGHTATFDRCPQISDTRPTRRRDILRRLRTKKH